MKYQCSLCQSEHARYEDASACCGGIVGIVEESGLSDAAWKAVGRSVSNEPLGDDE